MQQVEITPNTTPKCLVDWLFINDFREQDRLVSAFDCLLQDLYNVHGWEMPPGTYCNKRVK